MRAVRVKVLGKRQRAGKTRTAQLEMPGADPENSD